MQGQHHTNAGFPNNLIPLTHISATSTPPKHSKCTSLFLLLITLKTPRPSSSSLSSPALCLLLLLRHSWNATLDPTSASLQTTFLLLDHPRCRTPSAFLTSKHLPMRQSSATLGVFLHFTTFQHKRETARSVSRSLCCSIFSSTFDRESVVLPLLVLISQRAPMDIKREHIST